MQSLAGRDTGPTLQQYLVGRPPVPGRRGWKSHILEHLPSGQTRTVVTFPCSPYCWELKQVTSPPCAFVHILTLGIMAVPVPKGGHEDSVR